MMPHEIRGKTMNQLFAMGATEISGMNHKVNYSPMHRDVDPEMDEARRKATRELDMEDQDEPDFFADQLGAHATRFKEAMRGPKAPAPKVQGATQAQSEVFARSKKVDDAAAAIIMKALDTGVALDDPIYREMLEQYPHYQVKLERRENQISKM